VCRSAAASSIRKIYTCHSLSFEEFKTRNPKPNGALGRIPYFLNVQARKIIEKKMLNASDKVVVLSQFTKNRLLSSYGVSSEKIVLNPGGIDFKKFYPANNKIDIRNRLSIPSEKLVLLTVRNLVPRMGLENLLFAVRQAVERVPDIYLVLGGDGPLKNSLTSLSHELQLQDYVKFVGFIPETELPDYYRMADVFVLPTLELEGFGLVTLEALASGVPVLGTPVGGTVEILNKLDPKYLFRDTNPESMASLIVETCQQFKNNPGLWEEVSSQCRLFVQQNYSWDKNIACLEELFEIG
jgi:glycosyltransferase involved in cell wall biosynthesis